MDYEIIPKKALDYLSDIELSIIGYCCFACFLKIPDEPLDDNQLITYVRGKMEKLIIFKRLNKLV